MTVAGIIEQYNTERPNSIEDMVKLSWLKKCETSLIEDTIKNHYGAPTDEELFLHLEYFAMDTDLLLEEPYDDVYIYYLDQRIAYNNNDMNRYNASMRMYNNALLYWKQKYNREHMVIKEPNHLLRHEVL